MRVYICLCVRIQAKNVNLLWKEFYSRVTYTFAVRFKLLISLFLYFTAHVYSAPLWSFVVVMVMVLFVFLALYWPSGLVVTTWSLAGWPSLIHVISAWGLALSVVHVSDFWDPTATLPGGDSWILLSPGGTTIHYVKFISNTDLHLTYNTIQSIIKINKTTNQMIMKIWILYKCSSYKIFHHQSNQDLYNRKQKTFKGERYICHKHNITFKTE